MFIVIEVHPRLHPRKGWKGLDVSYLDMGGWIVWCGWQDAFSARWTDFEEACRDAALKEATYQIATGQAIV